MLLEVLGAGADVFAAFQPHAAAGLTLGRIATAEHEIYRLLTENGEAVAEPSGGLRFRAAGPADVPVTGDWVAARMAGIDQAIVEAVLPRRTCFSRRAAGKREEEQPLAANIDLVFLVCGLDHDFNLRRLERYLTLAAGSGSSAVVVLNKADVCADAEARISDARSVAGESPVIAISALAGEIDPLAPFLAPGRTVALLGSSGAGKSTLANRLIGEDRFRTAAVRESDNRGRHTTSRRELVLLGERGILIDTPGLRELQLWAGTGSVANAFDEIAELASSCRYRDCTHSGEVGCAVQAALEKGDIDPGRFESYRKLLGEARHHEALTERSAALERKRKWKGIRKAARQFYKLQG